MTIYGTPGGTPLNYSGFQGTQPGNAVQATLPGLAPNESVLAAVSRGALPINAMITNYGLKSSAPGRTIMDAFVDVDNGSGAAYVQNGGSANAEANGGSGPGAGQQGQYQGAGQGCTDMLPPSAPAIAGAAVQYGQGTQNGGTPVTVSAQQFGG